MYLPNLAIYFLTFIFLWLGSGLIISSIDGFSRKFNLSSFSISFFFLGILTSIPEFAVGLTSIAHNDPEIFVGNLLGGIVIIFLFVIPTLAMLGGGVKLSSHLNRQTLIFALFVMLAPAITILDRRVTNLEGMLLILMYLVLFFIVERQRGVFTKYSDENKMHIKSFSPLDILKLLLGIGIVLIASQQAVDLTLELARVVGVSAFVVSLIVLSLGTNLPELSLAVRSILGGKRDIAMGDYLGSAAANTLMFGVFTIFNKGEVLTGNSFFTTFLFILIALGMFYFFTGSERNVSRKEGFAMFLIYLAFLAVELS